MDNRITKKRLSDLLSYEWIFMIIICVVSIVVWELAYAIGSVKLTAGQHFRFYYDYTIYPSSNTQFKRELASKNTFSYDVLKLSSEAISQDYNVLADRLSIQEGDVIFTDVVGLAKYQEAVDKGEIPEERVRAFSLIDTIDYKIASLDVMLENAKKYLEDNFFVDGYDVANGYGAQNIDDDKVSAVFLSRNGKDNRFRTNEAKNQGIAYEKDRIVKLCENVEFMQAFIDNPANSDAIIRYTKHSQNLEFTKNSLPNNYQTWVQNEIDQGRGNDVYAINLGKLMGGKNISNFMQYKLGDDLNDIVIMAFEFTSYQPHLQYESLSFIC